MSDLSQRTLRMYLAVTIGVMAAMAGAPPLAAQRAPDLVAFDQYVARAARDWHVPGLAIAVVKDDSLVFAKGYGVEEIGKPARATEHTRFAIGSTTKAMTVAALAMLVDEGKLHWDDRIIDILPNFRLYDSYATREVTIRDLLSHRTGLPGTDLLWIFPENHYTVDEMIQRLRYVKPVSSFRSQWEYENVMYAVAGEIVAQVSGMPWDSFVRTRIFTPLGMNESIPLVSETLGKPNVASPHGEVHDTVRVVPVRTTDMIAPAGSAWSSVADMSKWMRFMLDSGSVGTTRLIQPATFREIIAPEIRAPMSEYPALELAQPTFFSYALGWFVQDYNGETVWMHTGSIDGMSAIIGLIPREHLGVYVLANLDHAELRHALMYKVFDMYSAKTNGAHPPRDWSTDFKAMLTVRSASATRAAGRTRSSAPKPVASQVLPLERYVGAYMDSTYGTMQVTLADGGLRAKFVNVDIGPLEHVDYDTFRSRVANRLEGITTLSFVQNGAGRVSAVSAFGVTFPRSGSGPVTGESGGK